LIQLLFDHPLAVLRCGNDAGSVAAAPRAARGHIPDATVARRHIRPGKIRPDPTELQASAQTHLMSFPIFCEFILA